MRITLIVSAFLGLLTTSGYAQEKALSKQELLQQLAIKEDQLSVLGKKIIDQEASVVSTRKRIDEFAVLFKEAQKQKFLEENPYRKINQTDLDEAYRDELMLFTQSFLDIHNKKEQLIIGRSFFKGLLNENDAVLFKFYLTKGACEYASLIRMIAEWDDLSNLIMNLYYNLDVTKEL